LESAEYAGEYRIRVRFSDGLEGEIDLSGELWGEVFEPLEDSHIFENFHVNEELGTITWASGADLAPEFLYERAAGSRVLR
jgi:hypothetical protein